MISNRLNLRLLTFFAVLAMSVGTVCGGVMPRMPNSSFTEEEHETEREVQREQSGREYRRREPEDPATVILSPLPFFLKESSVKVRLTTVTCSSVSTESSLRNGTGGPLLI